MPSSQNNVSIVVRLKDLASKGMSKLGNSIVQINQALQLAVTGFGLIRGAAERFGRAVATLSTRGGEFLEVQRAFTRSTGDQFGALETLRGATRGLISDYDLMTGLNRALVLGSADSAESFGELAETALVLGRALGVDAAFALESLNLGIGRQSKLILDNLGLIIDIDQANRRYAEAIGVSVQSLSEAQKSEAFRTEALRAAREEVAKLGGVQENAGDAFRRFTVAVTNLRDALATLTAESPAVAAFFNRLAGFATQVANILSTGDTVLITRAAEKIGIIAATGFAEGFTRTVVGVLDIPSMLLGKPGELLRRFTPQRRAILLLADQFQKDSERASEALTRIAEEAARRLAELGLGGAAGVGGAGGGADDLGGGGSDGEKDPLLQFLQGQRKGGQRRQFEGLTTVEPGIAGVPRGGRLTSGRASVGIDKLRGIGSTIASEAGAALEPLTRMQEVAGAVGLAFVDAAGALSQFGSLAEATGTGLASGFGAAWVSNLAEVGAGTKTLGDAMAGAFANAFASAASQAAQFYAAKGAAAIGEGLLGHPGGFAAAAKFFAAAAAFGILAGAIGRGAGGGGGRNAAVGSSAFAGTTAGLSGSAGGEAIIVIQGDPYLDMSDPRKADALAEAIARLGTRRKVTIITRPG